MGFFDNVKKAFGFEKKDDDVEPQNNENINNKYELEENEEKKEIQHVHPEESVLKDRKMDEQSVIRNFRYLDELVHSGVKDIVLDSDIVLYPDEESQYLNGIKLDVDDFAIDGNGHAIDARGLTRIFYCTGKNVTIKNIILKNGFTNDNGGAIYNNEGELTITESTLNNNTATNGGAIHNNNGELTITESTLQQNTAYYAGAIGNDWGELTITESTLQQNTAKKGSGGAIHIYDGELTMTESTLQQNTANYDGGAIHNNEGELTITKSTLHENTAKYGGAIHNEYGELTITKSTLHENTAKKRVWWSNIQR